MKRRKVLQVLPLSVASLRLFGLRSGASSFPMAMNNSKLTVSDLSSRSVGPPLLAEIKLHNGTPTLFLNGHPSFPGIYWVSGPEPDSWDFAAQAKHNSDAGIHIYAFDVGKGREWIGPATDPAQPYDFSTVEARFGRVLEADPQALFHLRIYLETGHGDWWEKTYPGECEVSSEGKRDGMSFASKVWRDQVREFLLAYADQLRRVGLSERVLAYQVGTGHTGEWVKGETSMYWPCGDYSDPMRRHFRGWLRQKYQDSGRSLQSAWAKPSVTFDSAEVPAAEAQLNAQRYTFRDPNKEQDIIDYYQCLAELCADCLIDFCKTVKGATSNSKLAGAFYGYLLDLAWNGGFFRERPDSDYSTYQRSGHLGLGKVLRSPYVDFLVSPYSYGFRGIGGDGPSMLPSESVRQHGKLCLIEDDTRTHADPQDPNYGQAANLSESVAILRRNFAGVVTRGQGIWWATWKVDTIKEPAFLPLLKAFEKLGTFALSLDRKPASEIAVFIDDESFFYESVKNTLDLSLIFQQRLWGLPRLGAPFDVYLLQDLLEGNLNSYKLCIFLNVFQLGDKRRAALKKAIRLAQRTSLWIYAPGLIKDDLSLENMADLTGFRFGMGEQPWGPFIHITDFGHPITRDLDQDLFWGTNSKLAPLFHVDDPEAQVLGQVVYSQGNCKPGFAVKKFPEWTSIYSAAPNLPASVLRGIARFAGVHIYSDAGDVLYATRQLLGVHTSGGGKRVFKLPIPAEIIHDLFEKRTIAKNTAEFEVTLPPASTALFYTGDARLLMSL
jgi:beta-galactosidase